MLIQALNGNHDRQSFDCGRVELNNWLSRVARQHQDKGLSRTFVAVLEDAPSIILAYYALTLTEVDTSALSPALRKKLPRIVPGLRLGRLAVSLEHQGKRLGELLLLHAMEKVHSVREHAGVVGLFVDALDERAAGFYQQYGFVRFQDDPLKLFLPV